MPKPAALMIAIGLPHGRDEDSLDREKAGNDDSDGDRATQTICDIARALQEGGPSAVRDLRTLAGCLEEMADAVMERDSDAFEQSASDAADGLHELLTR
jgi:hypothetical protein